MRVYSISKRQYNDLNDNALDTVVTEIVAEFPRCGEDCCDNFTVEEESK